MNEDKTLTLLSACEPYDRGIFRASLENYRTVVMATLGAAAQDSHSPVEDTVLRVRMYSDALTRIQEMLEALG
jgi:hypothetical protein